MTPDDIKQLKETGAWPAFEDHIRSTMRSLDSLEDIDFTNVEAAAVSGKGRQLAKEMLAKMLEPFTDLAAKDTSTKEDVEKEAGLS